MATPQPNLQRLGEAASRASSVKIGWNHSPTGFSAPSLLRTRLGAATGRRIRDLLHGTWRGHPLHPVLTDVPLGAWTLATVLDLWGGANRHQDRAADAAIGVGLAGAVGAAVTGMTDWQHTAA